MSNLFTGCPVLGPVAMIRPILAGSRDGRFPGQAPGTTPGRGPRSTLSARTVQGLGPDPGLDPTPHRRGVEEDCMSPVRLLAQEASAEVEFGSGETLALFAIMAVCLLALVVAFILVRQVLSADQGSDKMREIARAIQEGSRAYLSRQFRTLAVFVVLLFFLLLL